MKSNITLYRGTEDASNPLVVGVFACLGDALWSATCFASHNNIGKHPHWVEVKRRGKVEVHYPSGALRADTFNIQS